MQLEFVRVTHDGPVSRLTLTRPERRNALSLALMQEVIGALGDLPDETQAVVVAGEGLRSAPATTSRRCSTATSPSTASCSTCARR